MFASLSTGRNESLNHLLNLKNLYNRYFAMRHGHSLANQQGVIVSHPENGIQGYGLSERGVLQVTQTMQSGNQLDAKTLIITSDFKRASGSAAIVHQYLECESEIFFDVRLRERNFGDLELTADSNYGSVWEQDQTDPDNHFRGVESANQVMQRVTALVFEYENKISGKTLLLISHGDALQILQTAFLKEDASRHRAQMHLDTAEIRQLALPAAGLRRHPTS